MTNRELLKEIHRDTKTINRNIQRLVDIGLTGLLSGIAKKAKEEDDETGKTIAKVGLLLVVVSEFVLLVGDLIDYRKARVEDELENFDNQEEKE